MALNFWASFNRIQPCRNKLIKYKVLFSWTSPLLNDLGTHILPRSKYYKVVSVYRKMKFLVVAVQKWQLEQAHRHAHRHIDRHDWNDYLSFFTNLGNKCLDALGHSGAGALGTHGPSRSKIFI